MPDVQESRWIDKVREEHRRLRSIVMDLESFVSGPRPEVGEQGAHTWSSELSSKLVRLHDELFRHFRFEEEGGMVEEVSIAHPRAASEVDLAVEDHKKILVELREIMTASLAYSGGIEPEEAFLRRRVTELIEHLHRHEREETDLIQRLEYRDSAASD